MVHLFLGYRKTSADWRDEVLAALSVLPAIDGGETWPLTIWSDNHLLGGDDWAQEIGVHIDHADLFLLLVTTDLTGGYALEIELQRAAERARAGPCRVIPIIVDNVLAFLRTYGLDEFRRHAIPRGGVGLSQRPYSGDKAAWLNDVVEDVKAAVLAILGSAQMQGPDIAAAFEACAAAVHAVIEVAQADREALAERLSVVNYAADRTLDALRSDTPRILDLLVTPRRLVQDARRAAAAAGAGRSVQALKDLTAELDDLSDAARRAGLIARADAASGPSPTIDRAAPDNAADLAGLEARLDEVDRAAQGLAQEAQAAAPAAQAVIQEAAERLGAESRLVRAASADPEADAAEIEATTDQLEDTVRSVAALPGAELTPRARGLISVAREAVTGVVRLARRIVSRAFGRKVPPAEMDLPDSRSTRLTPGAIWRDEIPGAAESAWPTMVTLPVGEFRMGSPVSEEGREPTEGPQHTVTIRYLFAMGQTPVTFAQWDAAITAGAPIPRPRSDYGEGRDVCPVSDISWEDAQKYIAWLNDKLQLSNRRDAYRLPSESEWEYACRAGTVTPYSFGEDISSSQANFYNRPDFGNLMKTFNPNITIFQGRRAPAASFPKNSFGLFDMHGNVWEWCADIWCDSYRHSPTDGSAAHVRGDPSRRVIRGGSASDSRKSLRSASRAKAVPDLRIPVIGFRLARSIS